MSYNWKKERMEVPIGIYTTQCVDSFNNHVLLPFSGLSSKTQELTALFLVVRLICSAMIEGNIHTILDFISLSATAWVIYMIRFKLKSTYIKELDNFPLYYVVTTFLFVLLCILWIKTFCLYSLFWIYHNLHSLFLLQCEIFGGNKQKKKKKKKKLK